MTNVAFDLNEYEDIEVRNAYQELVVNTATISEEDFKKAVWNKSRDNARTPMQWDDSENAGFTDGTPWFKLNPRYKEINVARALKDKDSVFYYYKKLIALRHIEEFLTDASYELILPEDTQIFAYLRKTDSTTWVVAANLSEDTLPIERLMQTPELVGRKAVDFKIQNYERASLEADIRPYEAFMVEIDG